MVTGVWMQIESWHRVSVVDEAGWHTRCGRVTTGDAPVTDELPLDEKSCETCLRLVEHDAEQPVDNDPVVDEEAAP
jgi:hypothetical protein